MAQQADVPASLCGPHLAVAELDIVILATADKLGCWVAAATEGNGLGLLLTSSGVVLAGQRRTACWAAYRYWFGRTQKLVLACLSTSATSLQRHLQVQSLLDAF